MSAKPTRREQYANIIRPVMLFGLQDAELDGAGGTQRINEWVDWIAQVLAEARDLERDLLELDVESWRTAASASMTRTDQLRGQLENVRRTLAAAELIEDTPPDSDARLASLVEDGLGAFWARQEGRPVTPTEQQADRLAVLAAAIHTTRRRSAWTREQQARHRARLTEALDGTEWHQPIPNPMRRTP
ncbi:hypothetical protein [Streptomyces sp. H27-H5]|uniref:hypothetical protein n=1 Tax=Streptomyces sp. H27-H5 TaxID=2996460 RepID=UPI00226FA97E|nr:hypothetical protein [Streptomyces sp. H27-H5]MCY0959938.1 hypothetical protein [Streptomyces sp. H27-H5]